MTGAADLLTSSLEASDAVGPDHFQANLPGLLPNELDEEEEAEPADDFNAEEATSAGAEQFDWLTEDCVVIERQTAIAVYRNRRGHVVIRAESNCDDDDRFILLGTESALRSLIVALQEELKAGELQP